MERLTDIGHPAGSYSLQKAGASGEHRRWHQDRARFPSNSGGKRLRFEAPAMLDHESGLARHNLAREYENFAISATKAGNHDVAQYAAGMALAKQGGGKLEAVLDMCNQRATRLGTRHSGQAGIQLEATREDTFEASTMLFDASAGGAKAAELSRERVVSMYWKRTDGHVKNCGCHSCPTLDKALRGLFRGFGWVPVARKGA